MYNDQGTRDDDAITATYVRDTKRYHRFNIDEGQEIIGTLYVPRGYEVPDEIRIRLRSKRQAEEEKNGKDTAEEEGP